jgi:hypothetical protein
VKSPEVGDIFSDADDTPRDERAASPAPDPLVQHGQPSGSTAVAGAAAGRPGSPRAADARAQPGTGGAERADGLDEERRQRLRQVAIAPRIHLCWDIGKAA